MRITSHTSLTLGASACLWLASVAQADPAATRDYAALHQQQPSAAYHYRPAASPRHSMATAKLEEAMLSLDQHGLNGQYYHKKLTRALESEGEALAEFLRNLVADLRFGATRSERDWAAQQPIVERELQKLVRCVDVARCLTAIAGRHPQYEPMQIMLAKLKEQAEQGGWPRIEAGKTLKLGMRDARVPALRELLTQTGDYHVLKPVRAAMISNAEAAPVALIDDTYDAALQEAVMAFQARHGLKADGVVGPHTRQTLNVPIDERIAQLALSLERLRKLPEAESRHHVYVNIPSYKLTAYDGFSRALEMDVIVGQKSRRTPEFSNVITTVGLNPTWTPTQKILSKDLLPKFANDPNYAVRGGYTVRDRLTGVTLDPLMVDWSQATARDVQVVQRSGRSNALGKVKFLLPQNDSIYLHDTAKPQLFKQSMRALSSGCIRLSDPKGFLDFIINAQGDARFAKLRDYYAGSTNRHISLDQPVHVTTTYFTAWINDHGQLEFYDDIYRKDDALKLALNRQNQILAMR